MVWEPDRFSYYLRLQTMKFWPLSFHYIRFPRYLISYFIALLVHVDDIIIAGNYMDEISRVKVTLDTKCKIKYLGNLKYYLGIEVTHSKAGISICQRKYYLDLLKDTCLLGYKPVKTPLDPSVKLHQDLIASFEDILNYRRLVGKLLYLTTTRPEIAFVT